MRRGRNPRPKLAVVEKRARPNLEYKRELLLHSYDTLLVAQCRIATLASSTFQGFSTEIETRQKLLFFDEIVTFSINARRLLELTRLGPWANDRRVEALSFGEKDPGSGIAPPIKRQIGFLSLISNIVHCRHMELLTNRIRFLSLHKDLSDENEFANLYYRLCEIEQENRWSEYAIAPTLLILPDKKDEFFSVLLKDLVSASTMVSEKIVEVCQESKIFLELEYRGSY